MGTPCLIHQPKYNMFDRGPERGSFDALVREGIGGIAFCPLAQGLLTGRYLAGSRRIPAPAHDPRFLKPENITEDKLARIRKLDALAKARGQSLAQMALAWVLRQPAVTSALIGASKTSQIDENLGALKNLAFSADELRRSTHPVLTGPAVARPTVNLILFEPGEIGGPFPEADPRAVHLADV
jgi:L-glyceraldehyde 3-phosphate reductase